VCEKVTHITRVLNVEKICFMCVVYISELMVISMCICDKKDVLFDHVIVDGNWLIIGVYTKS